MTAIRQRPPLRKQLTFVVIVVVVASAVGFILGAIGARNGSSVSPPWLPGLALGFAAGAFYLLLSGNRAVAIADDAARSRALAGPADGEAQLLVVREGFLGKLVGIDVAVDGVVRAQLKTPRFAALTLPPGRHEVTAAAQGNPSKVATVEIGPGETAVLRIRVGVGAPALLREPDVAAMRSRLARVPMVVE